MALTCEIFNGELPINTVSFVVMILDEEEITMIYLREVSQKPRGRVI